MLRSASDIGLRLLDALTPSGPGTATSLIKAAEGLPNAPNPLLDDAWRRFTEPWSDLHDNES